MKLKECQCDSSLPFWNSKKNAYTNLFFWEILRIFIRFYIHTVETPNLCHDRTEPNRIKFEPNPNSNQNRTLIERGLVRYSSGSGSIRSKIELNSVRFGRDTNSKVPQYSRQRLRRTRRDQLEKCALNAVRLKRWLVYPFFYTFKEFGYSCK